MFRLFLAQRRLQWAIGAIATLSFAPQVLAHHAMAGRTPTNFVEGFISGLAHPIIGLDHFAFVVASGLIAAGINRGIAIPIFFVLATIIGTAIHLQAVDLPFIETIVALSVILFGVLLAIGNTGETIDKTDFDLAKFSGIALAAFAAIAGIFHGYAYGEAIIGAQMTSLIAYLMGFALIQLIIAIVTWKIGKIILNNTATSSLIMRSLGLAIGTMGVVFLTASI